MVKKNYQFTQVPTNLFILLDNNCRSMLFTLIQLSSYYAEEDGWFFRRWEDLIVESNLSLNLSMATVQTLFNHHIIEAKPTGYGKGRKPNYYKINFEEFSKYDEISIEDAMKNPDLKIRTVEYKGSNFKLNLVRETVNKTVTNVVKNTVKSENNINNIDNVDNLKNINNINNKECINNNILKESNNNILEENNNKLEKEFEKPIEEDKGYLEEEFESFKAEVDSSLERCINENELSTVRIKLNSKNFKENARERNRLYNRLNSYIQSKYESLQHQCAVASSNNDDELPF